MADTPSRLHPEAPKELERYLVPTEAIIFLLRRHWLVLVEPVATVLAGLFVVGFLDMNLDGGALRIRDAAIVLWLILLGRLLWKLIDWHLELFIATVLRLIMLHGIITR